MKVNVEINETYKETVITIHAKKMTDEIDKLIQYIHTKEQDMIAGFINESVELLNVSEIVRFYTANQKVYAQTKNKEYTIRLRLYELEERLQGKPFIRISHSEIINLYNIEKMDLSFAGTIVVDLSNGVKTYVSRRYVSKIKNILGI